MTADRISYTNFRNIASAEVDFSPGVNVFLGNNAEGKTNALEGIYLLAAGKSFRTPRERELVRFGESFFEVELKLHDIQREQRLYFKAYSGENPPGSAREGTKKRECRKNGVPLTRHSELVGIFRAVLFCPEHLAIVKAGPAERRNFLDVALCQLRPVYLAALQRHNRILQQRNALLKQLADNGIPDLSGDSDLRSGGSELLNVYSEQLAKEASLIYRTRAAYIRRLNEYVKSFFAELSSIGAEKEIPSIRYHSSLHSFEESADGGNIGEIDAYNDYVKLLTSNTAREIAAGATLYGSHKDDVCISLGDRDARFYASQGQQRSLALAMKLGEGEISMEYSGEYPVFLFDDVLSELDPKRQEFLLSRLGERQVIMTSCTPPPFVGNANFISVKAGSYEKL